MNALKWLVTGYAVCLVVLYGVESTEGPPERARRLRGYIYWIVVATTLLWLA